MKLVQHPNVVRLYEVSINVLTSWETHGVTGGGGGGWRGFQFGNDKVLSVPVSAIHGAANLVKGKEVRNPISRMKRT